MTLARLGSTVALAALVLGLTPAGAVADDGSPRVPPTIAATDQTPQPTATTTPPPPSPTVETPVSPPKQVAAVPLTISLDQPPETWEDRPLTFKGKLSNGATNWYISLWQALP
ncbi:MAG: hypothetical protein QOH50_1275, partial [Kribbellaceae bacterium]|nr:hypothetical protein [Kribbellaceae bacterium]